MINLSVVIIAYNEEDNIKECILSVKEIADEIVVIDSYSTDKTAEISKTAGANVIQHPFESYIDQKNFAVDQATFQHVLSIDADERLSVELLESIKSTKENWTCSGYSLNRKNFYGDKWIQYGGWYPDIKVRMFKKGKGAWTGKILHESFKMKSGEELCHLDGDLLHYTYKSKTDHLERIEKYAKLGALANKDMSFPSLFFKLIFSAPFRFIKQYLFQYGFLDGKIGWLVASINCKEAWMKYFKAIKLKASK